MLKQLKLATLDDTLVIVSGRLVWKTEEQFKIAASVMATFKKPSYDDPDIQTLVGFVRAGTHPLEINKSNFSPLTKEQFQEYKARKEPKNPKPNTWVPTTIFTSKSKNSKLLLDDFAKHFKNTTNTSTEETAA